MQAAGLHTHPSPSTLLSAGDQEQKVIQRKSQGSDVLILSLLPDEVLKKIAEQLKDNPTIRRLSRVCERFHRVAGEVLAERAFPEFIAIKTQLQAMQAQVQAARPQVGSLGGRKITVISSGSVNRNTMEADQQALTRLRDAKLAKLTNYNTYILYLESCATQKNVVAIEQIKKVKAEINALQSQIVADAQEGITQLTANLSLASSAQRMRRTMFG